MLDRSIFRQPGQNKLSLFDVGLSGEIGEVLVVLPEPDLGLLEASHAWSRPGNTPSLTWLQKIKTSRKI